MQENVQIQPRGGFEATEYSVHTCSLYGSPVRYGTGQQEDSMFMGIHPWLICNAGGEVQSAAKGAPPRRVMHQIQSEFSVDTGGSFSRHLIRRVSILLRSVP